MTAAPFAGAETAHSAMPDVSEAGAVRLLVLLPSVPLGGMERAALRVAEESHRLGAAVHVLTERHWGTRLQREVEAIGLPFTNVSLPMTLAMPRTILEAGTAVVSLFVTKREFAAAHRRHNANALLATSSNGAYLARSLACRADTASVFRIPNPPVFSSHPMKRAWQRRIWRAIGESYDHLVCNSQYTANIVAETTGRRGNVRVVRNYPPSLKRRIETPAPKLPEGRRAVVFLGQIAVHKGVDILFEAAQTVLRRFPDVDVVLAGPTVWLDPYLMDLTARIADAGLTERFRVLGPIDDVQGLLRQGVLHVCPSVSAGDSFPNVTLDAKQAGLASVVLPTAGLPEAVREGEGIVTPDVSPGALAAALTELLADPERCHAMGKAARGSLWRHDPNRLSAEWLSLITARIVS